MGLVLAALRERSLAMPGGAYPLPASASLPEAEKLGELLAAGLDAAALTVPWAACQARYWRDRDRQRRVVAVVADVPANAAQATVEGRLAVIAAQAVVAVGAAVDSRALERHVRSVQVAAETLQEVLAEPDHPFAFAGIATAQLHDLAQFADTLVDFERLVEGVVFKSLGEGALPVPADRWQAAAARALAELLQAKVADVAAAQRSEVVEALLRAATGQSQCAPELHRQLLRSGLAFLDGEQLVWSRSLLAIGLSAVRHALQREHADWPWRLLPALKPAGDHTGRSAVQTWSMGVAWHGLRPKIDAEVVRDGVAALGHLVDSSCAGVEQLRSAVRPWLELAGRLALAPPQPADLPRLAEAGNTAQLLGNITQAAGFRFAVAALFDVLAILVAVHAGDRPEMQRRWPGLAWTLDRLGAPAAPLALWLRLRLSQEALSDPDQAAIWDGELASMLDPTRPPMSAAHAARMRGWLALAQGDVAAAQAWWTQASQRAQRSARPRLALLWALDVAQLLVLTGDYPTAVKLAKLAAERLAVDGDLEQARWAGLVWLLAAMSLPSDAMAFLSPDDALEQWSTHVPQTVDQRAMAEGIDPSALLRCGALLVEGRATEVQTMLQYFSQVARSRGWRGIEAGAVAAEGWCIWWLGDAEQACARWKDAARLPSGPAAPLVAGRLWADVARLQHKVGNDRAVATALSKALDLLGSAASLRQSLLGDALRWSEEPSAAPGLRKLVGRATGGIGQPAE